MTPKQHPLFWLALCLLAACPATAQAAGGLRLAQPNAARFPQVTLYAYPTDARGVYLPRLGTGAFAVTENGRPAHVLSVDSEGGALEVCLALDRSLSMAPDLKMEYAKAAAREFIRQLGPDDRASLVSFGEGCVLEQALTSDRSALLAAIDRTEPNGRSTTFYDGVYWSVTQVALRPQGSVIGVAGPARADARRVVVAVTDGNDLSSKALLRDVIDYARANGVAVCTVALGQDASTSVLDYLSRDTGGLALRAPSPQDLAQLYVTLAQRLRHEYRITIRSPVPARDATRREVTVRLPDQGATALTWYHAPGQGSLLVTQPFEAPKAGAAVASEAAGRPGPRGPASAPMAVGALMLVVGLGALAAGFFFWWSSRDRRLGIVDSNPRIDLMPLWVHPGNTRVGRGAECELVLDSREVSRVHARIVASGGSYQLIDEGSANGTYVNGRRVRRVEELRVGDVVRFGDREFKFAGEVRS